MRNTTKNIGRITCLLLLSHFLPIQLIHANEPCLKLANNEYEVAYCKVKMQGHGKSLPSFIEFQKSPEKMQYLLIKHEAKKIQLRLGKPAAKRPTTRPKKSTVQPPVAVSAPPPTQNKNTAQIASDSHCTLKALHIQCPNTRYRLAQNNLDAAKALSLTQLTVLNTYSPNQQSKQNYLATSYKQYIENMLSLGLGASTMSLTKFGHLLEQSTPALFVKRFQQVFDKLTKDRGQLSAKNAYSKALPESIQWCFTLTSRLMVCDNVQQNWVYWR